MTDPHVRLSRPPAWCLRFPVCSACEVDLEYDPDYGWTCPSCGTWWSEDATDGDIGQLYSETPLTGPIIDPDDWHAVEARRHEIEAEGRGDRP